MMSVRWTSGRFGLAAMAAAMAIAAGPVAEAQTAAPATASAVPLTSVEVVTVGRATLSQHLYTEGEAHALRREVFQFDRAGRVVQIGTDSDGGPLREGSVVKGPRGDQPGDLIALLADGDLADDLDARAARERAMRDRAQASEAALAQANERVNVADSALSRARTLVGQGVVPAKTLEEAQSAAADARSAATRARAELMAARADAEAAAAERQGVVSRLDEGALRASFDGVIAFLNVREGARVGPLPTGLPEGEMLRSAPAVVIAPDAFEIVAQVPWSQAISLRPGQAAQVTWAGLGLFEDYDRRTAAGMPVGELPVVEATVWAVAPAVMPDTRAVRVRLRTTGNAPALRDGLFVSARIVSRTLDNVIVVPRQVVQHGGGDPYVYVLEGDDTDGGVVHRRVVVTGAEGRDDVAVLSGLKEGETVVSRGQSRLMDGARVRVVSRKPQS